MISILCVSYLSVCTYFKLARKNGRKTPELTLKTIKQINDRVVFGR